MRIGLYGPYGFGNLGDAAIQQAMIQNIREHVKDAQIFGISLNPEDTQARHGIRSFPIRYNTSNPGNRAGRSGSRITQSGKFPQSLQNNRFVRLIRRIFYRVPQEILFSIHIANFVKNLDVLIASGGGQLEDSWGGTWNHPFSMFKWAVISRLRGVEFMILSVGAGAIKLPAGKFLIKQSLRLACYHSYRDARSMSRVEDLGIIKQNYVVPDLAYSLQLPTIGNSRQKNHRSVVGISPIAYCYPNIWERADPDTYNAYISKLTNFIAWLLQMDYEIIFCPSHTRMELPVIQDIKDRLLRLGFSSNYPQLIDDPVQTVDDVVERISYADCVIASRYHSVLLSHMLNKPVIALSYDEKVESLMQDIGQEEYCLPIEQFDMEMLTSQFIRLQSNSPDIKAVMNKKLSEYRVALDEQYDMIFEKMNDLASTRKLHAEHDEQ